MDLSKKIVEMVRAQISIPLIDLDAKSVEQISGIHQKAFKAIRVMPNHVICITYLHFLNILNAHNVLDFTEVKDDTHYFIKPIQNYTAYNVSLVESKSFFGRKLSPPLLMIKIFDPNNSNSYDRQITFMDNAFKMHGDAWDSLPTGSVSLYGAELFAKAIGCQVPTSSEWEIFANQIQFRVRHGMEVDRVRKLGDEDDSEAIWFHIILHENHNILRAGELHSAGEFRSDVVELPWEWTKNRMSFAHYDDIQSQRSKPMGSYEVKKIELGRDGLTYQSELVPPILSFASYGNRGFRCIYYS
jgi:hypothetical protein